MKTCTYDYRIKGNIMATKNHLKILDIDEEKGIREKMEKYHTDILKFCRKYDLVLDCATSDNVLYLEDGLGGMVCIYK